MVCDNIGIMREGYIDAVTGKFVETKQGKAFIKAVGCEVSNSYANNVQAGRNQNGQGHSI